MCGCRCVARISPSVLYARPPPGGPGGLVDRCAVARKAEETPSPSAAGAAGRVGGTPRRRLWRAPPPTWAAVRSRLVIAECAGAVAVAGAVAGAAAAAAAGAAGGAAEASGAATAADSGRSAARAGESGAADPMAEGPGAEGRPPPAPPLADTGAEAELAEEERAGGTPAIPATAADAGAADGGRAASSCEKKAADEALALRPWRCCCWGWGC